MSDDAFMLSGLRKPPQQFVRHLRQHLEELDVEWSAARAPRFGWAAGLAAAAVLAGAFSLPPVRAAATAFLDLFRVVNFAPVSVQASRLSRLGRQGIDLPRILGEQTQELQKPSPLQTVASPQAAAAAAGIPLGQPTWMPVGMQLQRVEVMGGQAWRFTASTAKLQQVLTALGIDDVQVPTAVDGQAVTMSVAPVVRLAYDTGAGTGSVNGNGNERVNDNGSGSSDSPHVLLVESRQPAISLPQGVDLAQLGEIALRVLGADRAEAYRLAQGIDWRTTLIVPIPADVASFRKVNIEGHEGLLIVTARRTERGRLPAESRILWSTGDRVFGLIGNLPPSQLFDMAQSVH
jgi:hypothetical protein